MHINYHREGAPSKALEELEVVEEFKYLGARLTSSLPEFRQRRGIFWNNLWKSQTIWRSTSLHCVKHSKFGHFSRSVVFTPEA